MDMKLVIDNEFILKVISFIVLCCALYNARKYCTDTMSSIGQLGDAKNENGVLLKQLALKKMQNNFWIAFAITVIIVAVILDEIGHDLFIALLLAGLAGLGIKEWKSGSWDSKENTSTKIN